MNADAKSIGLSLGLAQVQSPALAFGEHDGYPMQVTLAREGNGNVLRVSARWDGAGKESGLRSWLEARGLVGKRIAIDEARVTLVVRQGLFGMPAMAKVLPEVHALIEELRAVAPAPARRCAECGGPSDAAPVLLRGSVARVCPSCLERLTDEAAQERREYASRTANLPLATVFALAAGAAGAALYGGVMAATNRMFWALAIITGVMVSYAAVKGAGKSTRAVQGIAAAVTVVAVLAGLLSFIGWQVQQDVASRGNAVDWMAFLRSSPQILLASGSNALFSLAGGMFGAFRAIRHAAPPAFERVSVATQ